MCMISDRLPISNEKFEDIMELSKYCKNSNAKEYFAKLPHCTKQKKKAK